MGNPLTDYVPLFLHVLVVMGVVGGLLLVSCLLGPHRSTVPKSLPYESGTQTPGTTRQRFSVHFYLVAMLFILFDVEAVFLFAWSVAAPALGLMALVEVVLFVAVLGVGLAYAWRKGALSWQ